MANKKREEAIAWIENKMIELWRELRPLNQYHECMARQVLPMSADELTEFRVLHLADFNRQTLKRMELEIEHDKLNRMMNRIEAGEDHMIVLLEDL